ncbi:hypothetical protein D3C78_1554820 [compost metagenome]
MKLSASWSRYGVMAVSPALTRARYCATMVVAAMRPSDCLDQLRPASVLCRMTPSCPTAQPWLGVGK